MEERSNYMKAWRQLLPVWGVYTPFVIWYLSVPIGPTLPPIAPPHMYRLVVLGLMLLFFASTLWNANAVQKILREDKSIARYGLGAVFHTLILFLWLYLWAQLATEVFPMVAREQIWKILQIVVQMWLLGGILFFFLAVYRKLELIEKIRPKLQRATSQTLARSTIFSLFIRFGCSTLFVVCTIFKPFWLEGVVVVLIANMIKEFYKF